MKILRLMGYGAALPTALVSQSVIAQEVARPPRIMMAMPTPPSAELNTMQLQINQLIADNQKLRADLTAFKQCFDQHHHWAAGVGQVPDITTPTKTSKAPGIAPIQPPC
jgi:hypothetical protein